MKRPRRSTTAPPRKSPAGGRDVSPPKTGGGRKWAARAALAVLTPVVALGLLELGLRAFGYGYPTRFFMSRPDGQAYVPNHGFAWRFIDRAIAPRPHPAVVPVTKAPGTYRLFILGESAALGTPDPAYSFGRILEVVLRQRHPGVSFEVINTAVTALNSHAVRLIAEDCARHQPDLFVVYMGHNEVVGPYGPATTSRQPSSSLPRVRAGLWAKSLRLGQLWDAVANRSPADASSIWSGMEMFAAERVAPDDPRRQVAYDHFRANLSDVIAAGRGVGARVVVGTVGANLRDCPPFASLNRPGLSQQDKARWEGLYLDGAVLEGSGRLAEAVEKYRAAMQIDDRHAELHYRLARCCLALQRPDDARRHFALARDCDALPLRADSRLNEIIRQVAGEREAEGVFLADIEPALGQEMFWDHAHLRFSGSYAVARAVLSPVEAALGLSAGAPVPPPERCAELLAETPFDRQRCSERMLAMMSRPPFTGQLDHAQRLAAQIRALAGTMVSDPELARSAELYTAALAQRPDDWQLRFNFATLLLAAGRAAESAEQMNAVVQALPGNLSARQAQAAVLLETGAVDEAASLYRAVLAEDPTLYRAHKGLGDVFVRQGKLDEAADAYRTALRLNAAYTDARTSLGKVRLDQGDVAGARADFEGALKLGLDADAEHYLGTILAREEKLADALPHIEQACRLRPADVRFQKNCGAVLLGLGRIDEAADRFRAAVELSPSRTKAHAALAQIATARGRAAEVDEHLRKAAERGYDRGGGIDALAEALTDFGAALMAKGDQAGARASFESALKLSPDPGAAHHLSTLFLKGGKPAEALALLERACLLRPGDVRLQHNCGVALLALGRTDEAVDRFRAAVALDPGHVKAHTSLGQIAMSRGRIADAITHYRQLVVLKGDQPDTLGTLAWLLATAPDAKLRDGPEAVKLAEQACRLTNRRDHTCLDALSAAYAAVGRFEEAIRAAREAVAVAEAAGAAEQALLIRRRLPVLEAHRPFHP